ncbi:Dbl homology domain-containing protein [Boletus edulis BED1]|uniref:Dbl homology domain-containing protein n=1 Tax=Boletus edulis BED1 TaxID=1328754 RepID=A0AAD4GA12_BOLED|nr:Dbl homology domain-containing protein [Boletus edulis BED1]
MAETNPSDSQRTRSDSGVRAAAPRESHEDTRRTLPMWELFSSERMYAQDLALVCNIHLPLARGRPVSIPGSGSGPSPTSGSSPSLFTHPPPMTDDDVRSIFRNISDIASLSSRFVERLETVVNRPINEGGSDEDNVGNLFLDIIPDLRLLYKPYLSTHSVALSHLQRFSQSPANRNYTAVIQSHLPPGTDTPDLASFLEKPKQRIPEYCRLLHSIIVTSSVSHRDLTALAHARSQMDRVARKLRNDRKFILFPLKIPTISIRTDGPVSTEADDLAQLENRLRQYPIFLDDLARHVKDLEVATRLSVESLQQWVITFSAVLGPEPSQSAPYPPANAAFTPLLSSLLDLCKTMESDLQMSIIPFNKLKAMTERPKQLLDEMHTLESHTPSTPFAKFLFLYYFFNRRRRYTDLRSKLLAELPLLLIAMDRAIGLAIRIAIQGILKFVERIRDKWMGFFNSMVSEDDEHYDGTEIVRAWSVAWEDGRQKLMTWEEVYVLRESTERDAHPGRSEAGLSATLAEVPPTNDVPAVPPDSGTKTSNLLSISPQSATVPLHAPTMKWRKTV